MPRGARTAGAERRSVSFFETLTGFTPFGVNDADAATESSRLAARSAFLPLAVRRTFGFTSLPATSVALALASPTGFFFAADFHVIQLARDRRLERRREAPALAQRLQLGRVAGRGERTQQAASSLRMAPTRSRGDLRLLCRRKCTKWSVS